MPSRASATMTVPLLATRRMPVSPTAVCRHSPSGWRTVMVLPTARSAGAAPVWTAGQAVYESAPRVQCSPSSLDRQIQIVFCRRLYVAAINETDCRLDEPGIACSATSGVTPNGAASPDQVWPPSRLLSTVMSGVTPAQPRPSSANVIWVTQPAVPATTGSQDAPRSLDRFRLSGV